MASMTNTAHVRLASLAQPRRPDPLPSGWLSVETESLIRLMRSQGIDIQLFVSKDKLERFAQVRFGQVLRMNRVDFDQIWDNRSIDMMKPL